ncbi:MAG: hypothetical protein ACYC6N_16540 [Pirellulaceae bacterium]
MPRRSFWIAWAFAWAAFLTVPADDFVAWGQTPEWMPTTGTHAWSRFGPRAWKEVRVRTYAVGENGEVLRSSTTVARTRVMSVERQSFSLCVSSTVEMGGREFLSEPQTFTREVAPQIQSAEAVGDEKLTIGGREFGTQVIRFVTTSGTQKETNTIHFCKETTPQLLRRVTTSVDALYPDQATETTVAVSELNKMADILGELKCTWAATTVVKLRDKTVTVHEVNCAEVPGELVSQITEEHDANGVLVARKELELIGYGYGRSRFLFRRR